MYLKVKKKLLEEKLRLVEDVKKEISKIDSRNYYKENMNPKKTDDNNAKLRNIYMNYEDKAQDLSLSRIGINNNTTVFHEASSKMSKAFGKLFKSKKQKAPENILTTDVLKDLGFEPSHKTNESRF